MEPEQKPSREDRYDVSGNVEAQYVDQAQTVMVNKQGVTDLRDLEQLEEEGLFRAYEALWRNAYRYTDDGRPPAAYPPADLRALYEWAGRWRRCPSPSPE